MRRHFVGLQIKNAEFYRDMAANCEIRAKEAPTDSLKQVMKDTARSWRELAEKVERDAGLHMPYSSRHDSQ
jgi:hypothetical protein